MASSETDILNRARQKIGAPPLGNFDDTSDKAVQGRLVYHDCLDQELRRHSWSFAMSRDSLAALDDAPAWGFDLAYELPADFLRLVQIDGADLADLTDYRGDTGALYRIEGRQLLTDIEAPLQIRYVRAERNTGRFDPLFRNVLVCRMAIELCEPVTQSQSKKQALMVEYRDALREARHANAIELPSETAPDDTWLIGRL